MQQAHADRQSEDTHMRPIRRLMSTRSIAAALSFTLIASVALIGVTAPIAKAASGGLAGKTFVVEADTPR